ncbi:hypothetical protein RHSIM_Rhsim10G0133000 [Rhododendron simsii]|uniref:THAP4-like heme-binding domain-containing protein n=1 Tax=Rhododendron simsii TaxID=118357 RepID=A0A834GDJ9_RHOSS|nr:hypothetical protein RHSIM_Rhsim10G0133000 [Rhododendron simsii]
MDGSESSAPQQAQAVAVHPAVEPLSYLLGTWRGQGEGGFPTINSFKYGEQLNFSHPGNKPVIAYSQKTWKLNSGEPMHAESGYWRPKPDGTIEVVIAQSTGLVEVQDGSNSILFIEILFIEVFCRRMAISNMNRYYAMAESLSLKIKGTYDAEEKVVKLHSELVGNASKVREITRVFKLVNEELVYVVEMATSLNSLQPHLKASLTKL